VTEREKRYLGGAQGAVLLVLIVAIAYIPALDAGFVWDDDSYILNNPHLRSVEGLRAIWLEPGATTQYYPLVHTMFWVEYHLWGLQPFGYHLVNILLHGAGAATLFLLLRRLGVPGAWFAAGLFALHPVHVESVAWVTERKNVLSGLFYFLSLSAFFRFAPPGGTETGRRRFYLLALLLFLFALLSKTVTATLPAAVLLLVWWKGGSIRRRDWAAMAPFLLVGIAAGLHTARIERDVLGAEGEAFALSLASRFLIAGKAFWFYLSKLAWPAKLTFIYPRWDVEGAGAGAFLFPAGALLLIALLWGARRRAGRGPLAALLFFGGTLLPALGFVNVYPFRFSFVADHFQHLASIGPIVLFAAVLARLLGRGRGARARAGRIAALLLLFLLAALTWRQCHVYSDLETLWRDTIEKNPGAWMARVNLGQLLSSEGRTEEAIEQYREALRIRPEYDKAHNNLGLALQARGDRDGAIEHFREALRINPRSVSALSNLGLALLAEGETEEAIDRFMDALTIRPVAPELHTNLAVALARVGRMDEAVLVLRQALRLAPTDPETHFRLGVLLMQMERKEEAARSFEETLRLDPDHPSARGALRALE